MKNCLLYFSQTLERAQSDGDEVKAQVQFVLTPIVTEQVTRLENLVRDLEKVSFHLTSRKQTTALSGYSSHSQHPAHLSSSASSSSGAGGTSNPLANSNSGDASSSTNYTAYHSGSGVQPSSRNKTPAKRTNSIRNLIEFTPGVARPADEDVGGELVPEDVPTRSKNDFTSITDALVQIEALRQELERVQMGLTLMCFSVEKLMDIVRTEPACCPSIFDFLIPRTQQSIGRDSTGLYTVTAQANRAYSSGGGSTHSTGSSGSSSTGRISGRIAAAAPTTLFKNHQIKKAGYNNINSNQNVFSISNDDDEED